MRAVPQIPFTQVHELEVRNALQSLVGRGLITRDECRAVFAQLDGDLDSQRLARVSLRSGPCLHQRQRPLTNLSGHSDLQC
jgi:hypothetical protein